jgi:hypothetical protein
MKRILILFSLIALIAMASCKKKESPVSFDNKALIGEIFNAGMSGFSAGMSESSKAQDEKGSILINGSADVIVPGPEGGNIHVTGSVTGSISFNDANGDILGGTLLLGFTETITDYAFMCNGQKYIMNGAPYISLTGIFTLQPGGATFGTASNIEIGGGVRVVGPDYNQTINIQITININSTGTGGDVSGTIGGETIYYTF